jgi:5-deoxy-glucuronate isomerase
MSKRHFTPKEQLAGLKPADMEMTYTSARRLELDGVLEIESGGEELCLFCLEGAAGYACGSQSGEITGKDMLYVPIGTAVTLNGRATVMQFGAPSGRKTDFACVRFTEVDGDFRHKVYGNTAEGTLRDVWNYIDDSFDSSRFLVGMCRGSNGGWTAWPPHEHAAQREETYVYFGMGDGFAIQCVYDDLEEPYNVELVRDGHLVSIPRGYHPNCGCPKGGISYVYCMVSTKAEDRKFMDLKVQGVFGDRLA